MSYNFHVGQDVVCIKDHSKGLITKDNVYTINGLRKMCCYVGVDVVVNIPEINKGGLFAMRCSGCNKLSKLSKDNTAWICSSLFAPLDELTDIRELQEVLEQPLFQVL